ncbi:MAG: sodium/proton-translocating pyrophosphatase, partial [Candidatus Aminicenantes bacterium]|nr:sodium/proton-translocating pyrophosphatase [Candidatus Aminicenantes bacterium]
MDNFLLFLIAPAAAIIALIFAFGFYRNIMKLSEGTDRMVEIAEAVRKGARAYLRQQYKIVFIFFGIAFIFLGFLSFGLEVQSKWTPFAFLTGGFFSGLAGFIGMITATLASARTTNQARESLDKALKVAFRSGAVMGLVVVGLGLIDIALWFIVLHYWLDNSLIVTTVTMLSFGMGASLQALFARVGGGIFTKAADVGADLVGKVEVGIPEDDPRNPATIADNVGDNVG